MRLLAATVFAGCLAGATAFTACGGDDDPVAENDGGSTSDGTASSSSGSSSGGPTDGGSPVFCTQFAETVCRRLEKCQPLFVHAYLGQFADCTERYAILCERSQSAPGASPYTQACVTALESASCEVTTELPECVSTGALPDDAPCEFARQCASGRCGGAGGPECGKCRPASATPAFEPQGASCENDECAEGLSCIGYSWSVSGTVEAGTCEPTRTVGQACTDSEDCNPGGRCRGDSCALGYGLACLDGGCAIPLGEGAPCPLSPNGPHCDVRKGLICDLTAAGGPKCAKLVFGNPGDACQRTEGPGKGSCFGTARCVGDGGSGTCVAKPKEGEPCTGDGECRLGAACFGGVCTVMPADRCK